MNSVYNHEIRIKLYEQLYKAFGAFNSNTWTITSGSDSPIGYSSSASIKIYQKIYQKLVFDDKIFDKFGMNNPKSPRALIQQVRWCTTTKQTITRRYIKTRQANRLAAYEAGFMCMTDILFLEQSGIETP